MFFLRLPCFCEKPVSPSLIRFLLFWLFMHNVALFGLCFAGFLFWWYTYIYRCMVRWLQTCGYTVGAFLSMLSVCVSLQRFRCPAAWQFRLLFARPCARLIPALFVCLFQSLHKIALQSSARSLRPFSRSPSTIPPDVRSLCGNVKSVG